MTSPFRFRFELRPVANIAPWGEPGSKRLSWFGLTDGWNCPETTAGRLLEFARPQGEESRWVSYQVVRLFDDVLELWPWVADPVPEDVASRFLGWRTSAEALRLASTDDLDVREIWWQACSWWNNRDLSLNYLTLPPKLHFWRTGTQFHLLWDAPGRDAEGPRWAVQHMRITIPFEDAQQAVGDFSKALLSAMSDRVATIERHDWRRPDCRIDTVALVAEQRGRENWAAAILSRTYETDWGAVRRAQDKLRM